MQYDLTRLGPYNFEEMCRSLFQKQLGPTVSQFGSGPDGGREATYSGRVDALTGLDDETWNGLVVLQAKFLQRSQGTAKDQDWLITQVKRELRHWANPESKRHKAGGTPDYLLLASNVVLSPASNGGIERLDELLGEYSRSLGLKGWLVWHADQIASMLDDASEIRRAYRGLITTGDVLSKLMDELEGWAADSGEALSLFTAQGLVQERFVRLAEAGGQHRLTLEKVGVDLPILRPATGGDEATRTQRAVAELVSIGDQVLRHDADPLGPARVVLVGGPGQGKTTLSHLLAQTYRAALLKDDPERYGPRVGSVVVETAQLLRDQRIPLPRNRRWPVRLDLASLAEEMSSARGGLLTKIAEDVAESTGSKFDRYAVKSWFRQYPWLLILDGYDEVASAAARAWIQSELQSRLVMADSVAADLMTVITTRPQGYEDDFVDIGAEQFHLRPLSTHEALDYASRFATEHFGQDTVERSKVLARVRRATEDPHTSRLMVSPLQITIMTLLLEGRERAPHGRFRLFDAYFDTIYRREMNKPGPTGQLLEVRRRDIEHVHERVGLELHAASERAETSDAFLSVERLRELARTRLREDQGHEPEQAESLAGEIVSAATNRLVLLVPKKQGIGFEVRSLQEYMAARALTNGPDAKVMSRLREAAPSAHWRNVWLLAVARALDVQEHLRGPVVGILSELGAEPISRRVGMAAELAGELLADAVAGDTPVMRQQLADFVLDVLDLPPRPFDVAPQLEELAFEREVFKSSIDQALQRAVSGRSDTQATGRLLLRRLVQLRGTMASPAVAMLETLGVSEAQELAVAAWSDPASTMARRAKTRTASLTDFIQDDPASYLSCHDEISALNAWMEALGKHKVRILKSDPAVAIPAVPDPRATQLPDVVVPETSVLQDAVAIALDSIPAESWVASAEIRTLLWRSLRRVPVAGALLE